MRYVRRTPGSSLRPLAVTAEGIRHKGGGSRSAALISPPHCDHTTDPQTETLWFVEFSLEPDAGAIAVARREASCFVLITDWLREQWDDRRVLAGYRHQYIIEGHTGIRWLKGPAAVVPVFLNKPERIRALGLILVLALMG